MENTLGKPKAFLRNLIIGEIGDLVWIVQIESPNIFIFLPYHQIKSMKKLFHKFPGNLAKRTLQKYWLYSMKKNKNNNSGFAFQHIMTIAVRSWLIFMINFHSCQRIVWCSAKMNLLFELLVYMIDVVDSFTSLMCVMQESQTLRLLNHFRYWGNI